jgi:Uma2 family endonuclease
VYRFERPLTPDEFFEVALPETDDGGKQELVDGEVVEMPGVGGRQGEVDDALSAFLRAYVRARGGRAFQRTPADACYRLGLPDGHARVRCPDRSVVTAAALAAVGIPPTAERPKRYLACRPALACEVVSDYDRKNPRAFRRKPDEYAAAGIPLVWAVDPDEQTVAVYDHVAGTGQDGAAGATPSPAAPSCPGWRSPWTSSSTPDPRLDRPGGRVARRPSSRCCARHIARCCSHDSSGRPAAAGPWRVTVRRCG